MSHYSSSFSLLGKIYLKVIERKMEGEKKEREIEIERKRGGHRVVGERAREGGGGVEER